MDNYYSVCAPSPPYQWDLTNSGNNVQIFARLIDDIYRQSQPIENLSFNLTFVKYASEFANFRVIENNEETRPTFKVDFDTNKFVGFRRYSNNLDKIIANEFNKNIFCPEKAIPKTVVDQIMQLIFSVAVRILLCVMYDNYYSYDGIGEWQMETLLSAYKMLAARNDNNENGKSMEQYNVNKVDCAFVRFGTELERRFADHACPIRYPDFSEYVQRMEAECGNASWSTKIKNPLYWGRSNQLEMELFQEPLSNYARAIQIDSHECKGNFFI
ncbi:hypothetical protein GPALN_014778 [Globodera pallida]|nr:hypothetical protein GPALN_014778 [Globodera pallida]